MHRDLSAILVTMWPARLRSGRSLMINAVILAAAGVWWFLAPDPTGQVLLMVIIAAMTVEMAMGFAVATLLHRERGADMTDMATDLSG